MQTHNASGWTDIFEKRWEGKEKYILDKYANEINMYKLLSSLLMKNKCDELNINIENINFSQHDIIKKKLSVVKLYLVTEFLNILMMKRLSNH